MTDNTAQNNTFDFKQAFRSVSQSDRRRAVNFLGAAGVTFAVLLLSRILWLFEPILDLIYYGTLSEIIYYIVLGVLFTVYIVCLNVYLKRTSAERMFLPNKEPLSLTRLLIIIAIGAVTVFITAAVFKFKLKVQLEMGTGVTMATALTNIAVYFYYAFHLWLGLTAAELVRRGLTILLPSKHPVPWGALFLVAVFGVFELIFELGTTTHMYPWLYFFFTFAYAAIFEASDHRYHVTYWTSIIIMVL